MKLLLPFHLHKVGAGFPSPATDYVEDDIDLNTHLIKNIPSTFLIRVQGKSMNKVGIHNNDLLVVDRSLDPKNFSTVIANVNEELVVKTFVKEKNQSFLTSGSKKLKDKIIKYGSKVFLVNTGWVGGSPSSGAKRISIKNTRTMITSILNGSINNSNYEKESFFGFNIPL